MRLAAVLLACLLSQAAPADTITVAVASNFRSSAEKLADQFEAVSGHELRLSAGSTGKLHAQIVHGAPYDLFLAADARSPAMLEASGLGEGGSRFTYALGRLVLWTRDGELAGCSAVLGRMPPAARLAIANPETAPYGFAAKSYLVEAGLWEAVSPELVFGENVAQALHFAVTRNVRYAIVAKSQAIEPTLPASARWCPLPEDAYAAIEQQAILLTRAAAKPAAVAFLEFLQSDGARDTIRRSGYGVP